MSTKVIITAMAALTLSAPALAMRGPPDPAKAGPRPDNYDEIVRGYLMTKLADPDSMVLKELRGPRVGSHKVLLGWAPDPHWWVCYMINTKNTFGAYVGYHKAMFGIAKGKVWDAAEVSLSVSEFDKNNPVDKECSLPVESREGTPAQQDGAARD